MLCFFLCFLEHFRFSNHARDKYFGSFSPASFFFSIQSELLYQLSLQTTVQMHNKIKGIHIFKMKLVLNTIIRCCHFHPSHFTEADLLLLSLNISHLPPLLRPSLISPSLISPWWSWHIIGSCASKNKQTGCQKRLMVVCQFYLVVCSPILWEEKGVRITLARNVRLKKLLFFRGT